MSQVFWEDVKEGDVVPTVAFPLSLYRMVVTAGANRDFNPHHHNSNFAKETGAPDMFANTVFLQGMWERAVRDYIGLAGTIQRIRGFRIGSFNTVGDTVHIKGNVLAKRMDGDEGLVDLKIWSENRHGISVGPGTVTVRLPLRDAQPK